MTQDILIDSQDNGVKVVTLNRPEKLNALNPEMLQTLIQIATESKSDGTKVVILTGVGRAFCSGGDISRFLDLDDSGLRDYLYGYANLATAIDKSNAVWIAAMNGLTYGGGLEICAMCDFRIAEEQVEFCVADVEVGALPTGGLSWRLPRLVGSTAATWMTLANPEISASRAFEIGLISQIVPTGQVLDSAQTLAKNIASFDRDTVVATRRAIRSAWDKSLEENQEFEVEQSIRLLAKPDINHRLQKRFKKEH